MDTKALQGISDNDSELYDLNREDEFPWKLCHKVELSKQEMQKEILKKGVVLAFQSAITSTWFRKKRIILIFLNYSSVCFYLVPK